MSRTVTLAVLSLLVPGLELDARAHCQVPCGIYDDQARVQMMREDLVTITKAVGEIQALAAKKDAQSAHQLVRWVMTKEQHAERIIRTISDYFLAQKIKPVDAVEGKNQAERAAYLEMLASHHAVLVAAMKCKQSSAMAEVRTLSKLLDGIGGYWHPAKP